jgi:hypothetical protein
VTTKFEVLDAIGPRWPDLPSERLDALLGALQNPAWRHDAARRRFGFRQFERFGDDVFAGYFVIESRLHFLTYDDTGNPPLPGEVIEFERVLAIFLPQDGRWIVHERRFFRTDLNKPLVRDRFRDALRLAHAEAGLGGNVRIEPFQQSLTDTQMLERLTTEPTRVIRVDIRRLHGQRVPPEYRFYNPRYDLDEEVHALFDQDLNVLEDAELEAAPAADIRDSKVAKALSQAGAVESYSTQDAMGRRYRVRRDIPATFELDLEIDDPDLPLDRIVNELVAFVRESYPSLEDDNPYRGGLLERPEAEASDAEPA